MLLCLKRFCTALSVFLCGFAFMFGCEQTEGFCVVEQARDYTERLGIHEAIDIALDALSKSPQPETKVELEIKEVKRNPKGGWDIFLAQKLGPDVQAVRGAHCLVYVSDDKTVRIRPGQ